MHTDSFMNNLSHLLAYKIQALIDEYEEISFYDDIRAAYEYEKKDSFEVFKNAHIDFINKHVAIDSFELLLFDIDFKSLDSGALRYNYMLDIAALFEERPVYPSFPFYNTLKVNAVFSPYRQPYDFCLRSASDSDELLLQNAKPVLLAKAADDLGEELAFMMLSVS
ncbi:MAG: hypothetical protein VW395_04690 [Methylotenera sp.]